MERGLEDKFKSLATDKNALVNTTSETITGHDFCPFCDDLVNRMSKHICHSENCKCKLHAQIGPIIEKERVIWKNQMSHACAGFIHEIWSHICEPCSECKAEEHKGMEETFMNGVCDQIDAIGRSLLKASRKYVGVEEKVKGVSEDLLREKLKFRKLECELRQEVLKMSRRFSRSIQDKTRALEDIRRLQGHIVKQNRIIDEQDTRIRALPSRDIVKEFDLLQKTIDGLRKESCELKKKQRERYVAEIRRQGNLIRLQNKEIRRMKRANSM